jgi:SnoaL-like domain
MSVTTHPLTDALVTADLDGIAAALADDVTFHTPILTKELHGKHLVLRFLSEAARIIDDLTYYDTVSDEDLTVAFWRGQVRGRPIEGATVTPTDAGQVHELTVLLRSWSTVQLFRDEMLIALANVAPLDAWELGNEHAATPDPNADVGPSPQKKFAPDVRFHSPMLTKTVAGEESIHKIHQLIGGIQGPRTYHARFEGDQRLIEYWTCVIEGNRQQGIDIFDFDSEGRVTDQRVWLRPWPVTTVLRDRAMAGQVDILPADVWLLPPDSIPLA